MRYRIVIDVDTTDPDMSYDEVLDAAHRAVAAAHDYLDSAHVELDMIEERGT